MLSPSRISASRLRCSRQSSVGDARDANVEQRPAVDRQHLMRHARRARLRAAASASAARRGAVVGIRDDERRHLGENALRAVRCDHGAQHRMPSDRRAPRRGERADVEARKAELDVDVAGDVAEGDEALTSQPVGLLHRRERERQVRGRRIGDAAPCRSSRRGERTQRAREIAEHGRVEDGAQRQVAAESRADLRDQARREQRVAAEMEEMIGQLRRGRGRGAPRPARTGESLQASSGATYPAARPVPAGAGSARRSSFRLGSAAARRGPQRRPVSCSSCLAGGRGGGRPSPRQRSACARFRPAPLAAPSRASDRSHDRLRRRETRVHQVLATLGYGDAIGHEVLGIQRVLRGAGYASEIFVETADPRLEDADARLPRHGRRDRRPTTC